MKTRILNISFISFVISFMIIAMFFPIVLNAQYANWDQYTNGRHITAIAEDDLALWVGTTGGLAVINKATLRVDIITTINSWLNFNCISAIAIDNQGYEWVGTKGKGLVHVWRTTGNALTESFEQPIIPSNFINAIKIRSNEVWIATNAGLARWSGTTWLNYNALSQSLPSDTVTSLALDKNNNLWIGTSRGVVRYDGTSFTNLSLGLSDRNITSVATDTSGRPWVGTLNGGAAQYQGTTWSVYGAPSQLPSNFVNAVAVDASNRVWVGTLQNGLVRYQNFNWYAALDTSNSQIPDNNVTVLLPAMDGGLWVGTRGNGLAKLAGSAWSAVSTSNSGFTEDNIISVAVASTGDIWTCGSGDVSHFNGTTWTTYKAQSLGLFQGGFTGLALDSQGLPWVGTFEQGVLHFNGSSWTQYNTSNTAGFPDNFINAITVAPNGDVWVATYNGLGRFNGTSWITYNTTSNPSIPNNIIRAIGVGGPNNTVWISDGQSNGPLRFDTTAWTVVDATSIGVTPGSIQSIWVSETGGPWIGTSTTGIAHYTPYINGSWQYHSNIQNSTLPSNDIRSIRNDLDGNLWLGTSNGLIA